MDIKELQQFFNDISFRLGNISDQTSRFSNQPSSSIESLTSELAYTNNILTVLAIIVFLKVAIDLFFKIKKNKRESHMPLAWGFLVFRPPSLPPVR
ncbi:hypothetical protein SAMN04487970_10279 [Paenibacillus tianmuensis]|uniref:Uncharacterized protein n=1 Tax=Paenibacillus tianmuensis TaxID=624147 RepID=A0A1G4SFM7_9BACL|nr:hypothetical protein [Paenibacillus tianmuensis]SCW67375.1 hypothetical protein SAMN04487970_10279 [Paenibacillus tianmuensis]